MVPFVSALDVRHVPALGEVVRGSVVHGVAPLRREVRHEQKRVQDVPHGVLDDAVIGKRVVAAPRGMTQQPVATVPVTAAYASHTGQNASCMGMYRYASTPHPTVIAVEMAAYIRDLAVSLTKHSSTGWSRAPLRASNSSLAETPSPCRSGRRGRDRRTPPRRRGAPPRAARARGAPRGGPRGTCGDERLRIDHGGGGGGQRRGRGDAPIQMGPKARDVTSRRRRRFVNRAGGGTDAHAPTEARARRGAWADALTAPMRREGTPTEAIAAIAGEGQATVRARAFWVRAGASRTLCVPHTRGCLRFRLTNHRLPESAFHEIRRSKSATTGARFRSPEGAFKKRKKAKSDRRVTDSTWTRRRSAAAARPNAPRVFRHAQGASGGVAASHFEMS